MKGSGIGGQESSRTPDLRPVHYGQARDPASRSLRPPPGYIVETVSLPTNGIISCRIRRVEALMAFGIGTRDHPLGPIRKLHHHDIGDPHVVMLQIPRLRLIIRLNGQDILPFEKTQGFGRGDPDLCPRLLGRHPLVPKDIVSVKDHIRPIIHRQINGGCRDIRRVLRLGPSGLRTKKKAKGQKLNQ